MRRGREEEDFFKLVFVVVVVDVCRFHLRLDRCCCCCCCGCGGGCLDLDRFSVAVEDDGGATVPAREGRYTKA